MYIYNIYNYIITHTHIEAQKTCIRVRPMPICISLLVIALSYSIFYI